MRVTLLVISFFLFNISLLADGYKIKIKVKGVSDTVVYLGNYYADKKYARDTVSIDKHGVAVFEGDERLKGGIYMVLFPSLGMNYFEMLVDDDNQEFSLETDTADFVENMKVKGSEQNRAFNDFHSYMGEQTRINNLLKERYTANKDNEDSLTVIKETIKQNEKEVRAYWADLAQKWKGSLFASVVNAMRENKAPDFGISDDNPKKDSILQMRNYLWAKDHYFDYIDLKDDRMIRTPFLYQRLNHFMTRMVIQHPDSVLKEGLKLIEASRGSEDNFRYLVQYMFGYRDRSKLMGMDKVFIDISERYYLSGEATWADSTFLAKVKERVLFEKPTLIGNTAPALDKLETYEKEFVSLGEIDAKYTILIFWEPNCGHCKTTVPKLYKYYQSMLKDDLDVKVLSFYIHQDREAWEKFLEKKELYDWINAYDKYGFTYFRVKYDIQSTPKILLLDKDKKILGKQLSVEQIEQIIYNLEGKKAPVHEDQKKNKKP